MLKSIPQYLSTISDTYGLTKTLGVIDICTTPDGRPIFHVGNNSIIFRIRHDGGQKMLKCYTRDKKNLRRIYGEKCLREELYIYSDSTHGEWVDVILDDWIEGRTLFNAILECSGDSCRMGELAHRFDHLARQLLAESWAHGDLKPDNIIVTPQGELHLIDFDAMFRPEFAGERSEEIGTAAFQHPARDVDYFDKTIDDYAIALISTALHALATDTTLAERYDIEDSLLFHPRELVDGCSEAYTEVLDLFAREGMARQYRIAQTLRSTTPRLHNLREIMESQTCKISDGTLLTLENRNGLWGYSLNGEFVIPPLYDCGFEFSEGLAAVNVGGYWHYINTEGAIVLRCPHCEAVKSFCHGEAVVIENGIRKRINRNGEVMGG